MNPTAFAFLFFFLLSSVFLLQTLPDWSQFIPGGQQDTRLFLWNLWWFRHALDALGTTPFHTSMLFHPFGVSLLSHDFPMWNNLIGYAVQRAGGSIPLAANVTFLATWTMNGFSVFLLAREVLSSPRRASGPRLPSAAGKDAPAAEPTAGSLGWPAAAAGLYAMTSSYALARMMQNWGQFNFFGIALFLWAFLRARRSTAAARSAAAGAALAFTAACHYYFLIYSAAIWIACEAAHALRFRWRFRAEQPAHRGRGTLGIILAGLGAAAAAWIGLARPGAATILGVSISLRSPANALLLMWSGLMLTASAWIRAARVPRVSRRNRTDARRIAWMLGTTLALLSPLLAGAVRLALEGDYPQQTILWKTHPSGANLFALLSPNPLHRAWGPGISAWYSRWGLHPQEQAAAIGWCVLLLVALSRLWRGGPAGRRWLALAGSAAVLSLGPYLHLGSLNTWLPLPFYAWRLIPVFGNVRVPERWMAAGTVAWGVVLALALAELSRRWKRPLPALAGTAGILVLVENWPGVPAARPPREEPVYVALREAPPGGVLPLPFFAADSSIGAGGARPSRFIFPWDHLWAQRFHQHPMAGGYVGRVPRRLVDAYRTNAFFGALIGLQEGQAGSRPPPAPSPAEACEAIRPFALSYVLAYPEATAPAALEFAASRIPMTEIARADGVALYRLSACRGDR